MILQSLISDESVIPDAFSATGLRTDQPKAEAGPPQGFGRIRHKASDECVLRRIRPSAEIQAEFGLDPRLKHSGVTSLGVASFDSSRNFRKSREGHEVKKST
jgi:hypothetical protein